MTSSASSRRAAAPRGEGYYLERRWLSPMDAVGFGMLAVVALVMVVWLGREEPEDLPALVLAALGLTALVTVVLVSPGTYPCGHIRIDRSGLALWWPWRLRLPAAELGNVAIVPEDEAGPAARQGRYGDTKIGTFQSSYSVWGGMGPAVFVEQRRVGKQARGWLLSTRDPEGVVAALERVRDGR